jgi:DNA polymerase
MDVASAVKSTIRSFLRAPEGFKLPLFDFSTIENRVLAFVCECPAMLDTFNRGLDAYKMFAAAVLNRPYDSITNDERNAFKAAVLGLGYGLSAQRLSDDSLNKYGVELSLMDAEKQIRVFKRINPEVEMFWNALESAAKRAILNRCRVTVKCFVFNGEDPTRLEILLPSGRSLYLREPKIVQEDGRDGSCIEYGTENSRQRIWGSKLCAYVTQATARDLLAEALLACRDAGLNVIMSCHDEIVLLTPDAEADADYQKLKQIMHTVPAWLEGLPIMAEGAIQTFYHKP